jgi:hypothetical protein
VPPRLIDTPGVAPARPVLAAEAVSPALVQTREVVVRFRSAPRRTSKRERTAGGRNHSL